MKLVYGSISVLLFLICIFILSIVGFIYLQSIPNTEISIPNRDKLKQSKGILLSLLLLSAFGLIIQLLSMNNGKSSTSFSRYEGTEQDNEKCYSTKCEETLTIK